VLHGAETLQAIIETGVRLDTLVIRGVERRRFEGSDLPEICEAARIVWLDTRFRLYPHETAGGRPELLHRLSFYQLDGN